jgi:hypothetical protein
LLWFHFLWVAGGAVALTMYLARLYQCAELPHQFRGANAHIGINDEHFVLDQLQEIVKKVTAAIEAPKIANPLTQRIGQSTFQGFFGT